MASMRHVVQLQHVNDFIKDHPELKFKDEITLSNWLFKVNQNSTPSHLLIHNHPEIKTVIMPQLKNTLLEFHSNLIFKIEGKDYQFISSDHIHPFAYFKNHNGEYIVVAAEIDKTCSMGFYFSCINICRSTFNANKGAALKILDIYHYHADLKSLFTHLIGLKFVHDLSHMEADCNQKIITVCGVNAELIFNGFILENNLKFTEWAALLKDGSKVRVHYSKLSMMCQFLEF